MGDLPQPITTLNPGRTCRRSLEQHIGHRPQSSSASRFTAGSAEFFFLSQSGERPER
jgi:hypothetical protein